MWERIVRSIVGMIRRLIGASSEKARPAVGRRRFNCEPLEQRRLLTVTVPLSEVVAASATYNGVGFGSAVDIDADYAIIGTPGDVVVDVRSGSAYVFERGANGSWSEMAKLLPSAGESTAEFGYSVAIADDYAFVGAPASFNDLKEGVVFVFERNGRTWNEVARLTASDRREGMDFGSSIALDGDRFVVGAPEGSGTDYYSTGAVYVFRKGVDGAWSEESKLSASDGAPGDKFGASVAIDDDRIAVGAYTDDGSAFDSGSAYIFDYNGESWIEETKFTASDAERSGEFGKSVSVDGNTVVVGAHLGSTAGLYSGSAYIFENDGTSWSEVATLTVTDAVEQERFGETTAIRGDYVLVGAPSQDAQSTNASGSVYLYQRSLDGTWNEIQRFVPEVPYAVGLFGSSIAIDSNLEFLVGEPGEQAGEAYLGNLLDNEPPFSEAGGPYEVVGGYSVALDASASHDIDQANTTLTYRWDLDGDGAFGETGPAAVHGDEIGMQPTFGTAGRPGPETRTVALRVIDDAGATHEDTALVTITVDPNNDPPIGDVDRYTTQIGVSLDITAADGVLDNDSDPNSDPLTAILPSQPTGGQLTLATDGSFLYVPDDGYSGIDRFTYRAHDGLVRSEETTVTIVVDRPGNRAPQAGDDAFEMLEDRLLSVPSPGVLENDEDADGDAITVSLTTGPSQGELTLRSDGSFEYRPSEHFYGEESFTYTANDGLLDSNVATVTLTVIPVNDAPSAIDDHYETGEDTLLSVSAPGLTENDQDLEGDPLRVVDVYTGNTLGAVTWDPDGSFYYDPNGKFASLQPGETVTDTFRYRVTDGQPSDGPVWTETDVFSGKGDRVALDGTTAVTGNPYKNTGKAFIKWFNGTKWKMQARLFASDGQKDDWFGSSVAVSGDTAVIGAVLGDGIEADSGAVYIFTRNGDTWTEQAKLVADDGLYDDKFGGSVAIDGDTVVIGAIWNDDLIFRSGAAYVFTRTGTTWTQQAKLTASDAERSDEFGRAVDIDGHTVVVGARSPGRAYVYTRDGTIWSDQARLAPLAFGNIASVNALDLDGDTLLIGGSTSNSRYSGAAFIFRRDGGVWSQHDRLTAPVPEAVDSFASSVALDGNRAVIGALSDDPWGWNSGSAYVYEYDGTQWLPQDKLLPFGPENDGNFGRTVALDGDLALVGAYGSPAAHVYTFAPVDETTDVADVTITIRGATQIQATPGDDVITFTTGEMHVVTINGVATSYDPALVSAITIDGQGGRDKIYLTGGPGTETATIRPGAVDLSGVASLLGPAYSLHAENVEWIRVNSGGGDGEEATLIGQTGDAPEQFVGKERYGYLRGPGYYGYAGGFDTVVADVSVGSGMDRAYLFDTTRVVADDTFWAGPLESRMELASGVQYSAKGFAKVKAIASDAATPNGDRAFFTGTLGDDTFVVNRSGARGNGYAYLRGTDGYNYALGFDHVEASVGTDGQDRAYLYGTAADDLFFGYQDEARIEFGIGGTAKAIGFDRVKAYGRGSGPRGDRAFLYGSPGEDSFLARPGFAYLRGNDESYDNRVAGFDSVFADVTLDGSENGTDRAYLYDSAGSDLLLGWSNWASLTNFSTFSNKATGFDIVHATSENGGTDIQKVHPNISFELLSHGPWL